MTDAERDLLKAIDKLCRDFCQVWADADVPGEESFREHALAMKTIILARAGWDEMLAEQSGYDPAKWQGWTERGQEWLAAGCPPIEQESAT